MKINKNSIHNSAGMYLYKATVDLNSAKYLLVGFNEKNLEIDIEKINFELQQSAEKLLSQVNKTDTQLTGNLKLSYKV